MAKEAEKTQIPDIEQRHLTFPVEIRVEGEGKAKKLVGYAAVFKSVTDIGWFREQIEPGCFSDTIEDDDIRGLFNHDSNLILGRNKAKTLRLKEDSKGLWFEIDVPDTQVGRDTLTSVERGDVSGCSFAFTTLADAWDYSDEDSPLRTLKKARLYDVGPVTYPAYPDTSVAARSLEAAKKAQKPAEICEQPQQTPSAPSEDRRGTSDTAASAAAAGPAVSKPISAAEMGRLVRESELIRTYSRPPES
ncbi:MAG: HK97 family phage prohead protease [Phycisphaerales bacterium]